MSEAGLILSSVLLNQERHHLTTAEILDVNPIREIPTGQHGIDICAFQVLKTDISNISRIYLLYDHLTVWMIPFEILQWLAPQQTDYDKHLLIKIPKELISENSIRISQDHTLRIGILGRGEAQVYIKKWFYHHAIWNNMYRINQKMRMYHEIEIVQDHIIPLLNVPFWIEGFFLLTQSKWDTLRIIIGHRPFQELIYQIWTPQMANVFGQKISNWYISSQHLFELQQKIHPHLLQHILTYLPTQPTYLLWFPLELGRNYQSWEAAGTINPNQVDTFHVHINNPISGKIWIQGQHRIFI